MRRRDGLVPIGDALANLGFMARLLALCSLPRTNPGNRKEYIRRNGPYKLGMTAGIDNKLPFGNIPRLLLAWVCTEAMRTQSRVLILCSSLSEFMGKLGMDSVGGSRTRLRNQMRRLFNAHVQLVYEDKLGEASVSSSVTSRTEFWWDPKRPDEPMLWDSKIELGWDFYNEIIRHPVPLDMNILTALKRCALGLDLYLWLAYRTFTLKHPLRLTWRQVYCQFGPNPNSTATHDAIQNFRRRILRELKKIKLAWPDLNYATALGLLILLPSTPTIAPLNQGARPLVSPFPALSGPSAAFPGRVGLWGVPPRPESAEAVNRWFSTGLIRAGAGKDPMPAAGEAIGGVRGGSGLWTGVGTRGAAGGGSG